MAISCLYLQGALPPTLTALLPLCEEKAPLRWKWGAQYCNVRLCLIEQNQKAYLSYCISLKSNLQTRYTGFNKLLLKILCGSDTHANFHAIWHKKTASQSASGQPSSLKQLPSPAHTPQLKLYDDENSYTKLKEYVLTFFPALATTFERLEAPVQNIQLSKQLNTRVIQQINKDIEAYLKNPKVSVDPSPSSAPAPISAIPARSQPPIPSIPSSNTCVPTPLPPLHYTPPSLLTPSSHPDVLQIDQIQSNSQSPNLLIAQEVQWSKAKSIQNQEALLSQHQLITQHPITTPETQNTHLLHNTQPIAVPFSAKEILNHPYFQSQSAQWIRQFEQEDPSRWIPYVMIKDYCIQYYDAKLHTRIHFHKDLSDFASIETFTNRFFQNIARTFECTKSNLQSLKEQKIVISRQSSHRTFIDLFELHSIGLSFNPSVPHAHTDRINHLQAQLITFFEKHICQKTYSITQVHRFCNIVMLRYHPHQNPQISRSELLQIQTDDLTDHNLAIFQECWKDSKRTHDAYSKAYLMSFLYDRLEKQIDLLEPQQEFEDQCKQIQFIKDIQNFLESKYLKHGHSKERVDRFLQAILSPIHPKDLSGSDPFRIDNLEATWIEAKKEIKAAVTAKPAKQHKKRKYTRTATGFQKNW